MTSRVLVIWAAGVLALAALALAAIAYGAIPIAPGDAARVLMRPIMPLGDDHVAAPIARIILDLRLPRVILAALVGAGLAIVGCLLQTVTRNDLADPFLFGLSSGAAAGAVSVITIFGDRLGVWTLPIAAFAGALLSAIVLLGLVSRQAGKGPEQLIIAGLAVSFLFGALTTWLVFAGDQRAAYSVMFWSVGGLGLANWSNLPLAVFGTGLALIAGLALKGRLDALLAGEDTAKSLGVDVFRLRIVVLVVSALATASLVALSGVIGFVGLMIPHLARGIVGVRHGVLIVTAALMGAVFLLGGDLLSRVLLAPQELPVGIITASAGGVFVLVAVLKS